MGNDLQYTYALYYNTEYGCFFWKNESLFVKINYKILYVLYFSNDFYSL